MKTVPGIYKLFALITLVLVIGVVGTARSGNVNPSGGGGGGGGTGGSRATPVPTASVPTPGSGASCSSVPVPTTAVGHLLVLVADGSANWEATTGSEGCPSGYQSIFPGLTPFVSVGGSSSSNYEICQKAATGSEPASITVTNPGTNCWWANVVDFSCASGTPVLDDFRILHTGSAGSGFSPVLTFGKGGPETAVAWASLPGSTTITIPAQTGVTSLANNSPTVPVAVVKYNAAAGGQVPQIQFNVSPNGATDAPAVSVGCM